MLVFHFAPGSSSMAVHIALHEVGAAFEARPVSLGEDGTRSAAFLAISPAGKVPVLEIDGRALTEVAGILFYLARRYPEAGLWPEEIEAQAQAVSWMSFLASGVHPARRQGQEHALAMWQLAEARLGPGDWALGRYSVVDIHLFRLFWRFAGSLGVAEGALPQLARHQARMLARPAVQQTIAIESALGYRLPA